MKAVLLSFFLLLPLLALTQPNGRFQHFNGPDEPGQSSIRFILQDSLGFLWIGTEDGLYRFDGYQFHPYRHDPDDPESLSDNFITILLEDHLGYLWVGTQNGLNRLDRATGRFQHFRHDPQNPGSLPGDDISSLYEDRKGNLWVGIWGKGLHLLDRSTGEFEHFRHDPKNPHSLSNDFIFSRLLEDRADRLWIGTLGGLDLLDRSTGRFQHFRHDPQNPHSLGGKIVLTLYEDREGNLWIGMWDGGMDRMDYPSGKFKHHRHDPENSNSLSSNTVRFMLDDHQGYRWIATSNGLNRLDPATGRYVHFKNDQQDPYSLTNNHVDKLLMDSHGNLWIGTYSGLNYLDLSTRQFTHFRHYHQDPHSLSANGVLSFLEDRQGRFWIGTEGGLNRLDRTTGKFDHLRHDPQNPQSLSGNFVKTIYEDRQGFLWIGTSGSGLDRLDPKTGRFQHFRHDPNDPGSLSFTHVTAIQEDSKGILWVGTVGGGLNRMDPRTGHFKHFLHDLDNPFSLSHNNITSIYLDRKKNLWIGNGGGLDRLDSSTGQFEHFRTNPGHPESISDNRVLAIFEDQQGNLWIGTSGGLNRFDSATGRFEHYRAKDGLASDLVYNIVEDQHGHLWLNTNNGLSRFDPQTKTFLNIADGLSKNSNYNASYKSPRTGEIFLSGANGFITFHPDSIRLSEDTAFAPLVLSTIIRQNRQGGKPVTDLFVTGKEELTLSYQDYSVTFEFAALSLRPNAKTQYKYQLAGLSDKWYELGARRDVSFTNLPPGRYALRVTATNGAGAWNPHPLELEIRMLPPWWRTAWAYACYSILFLVGLYLVRRAELRKQNAKLEREQEKRAQAEQVNAQLQRVDQLKDQFLANTSHELRTPLQGIIGLSETLYEQEDEPEKREDLSMIISSGKRLSSLVNDILDFSKLHNADLALQLRPVHLHAMVDMVLRSLAPLAAGKNLELINSVPADAPPVDGDENRLQQILYNLVGNAIKFTEKGKVEVGAVFAQRSLGEVGGILQSAVFSPQSANEAPAAAGLATEDWILVTVKDTGIGIPTGKREAIFQEFVQGDASTTREFAGTGLGLSVSKKLVELHGGRMWVESEVGKGSTFYFSLPLSDEAPDTPQVPETLLSARLQTVIPVVTAREEPVLSAPGDGIHILVVDDEPINQQVLKHHLSGSNFRLKQAMNGEEALRALENEKFDLVLLDVMMPRLSGYEVCEKIREKFLPSELPVIMVTAKNQVQDLVQGLSIGANDYLAKPFTKEEFLARVKTQLDLHRIHSATAKFVPNEFLRVLGRDRITEVILGDQTQREVTVLFSDLRDYTTLAETMTPEENFRFVNAFHGRMGPIIGRHEGFVNQYLGDAVMAVFPDHPQKALQAAIAIQQELAVYNDQRARKKRPTLKLGIGLHTGQLIMGIIGDAQRLDAATISDTVNTASRIESLTKHYGVNILLSEDCLAKITAGNSGGNLKLPPELDLSLRYLGQAQVKGRKQPVGIFECFAGDAPALADAKAATIDLFSEGLRHFQAKAFAAASTHFGQVLQANPHDQPARHYLTRAARHMTEGTPEDWTGVEVMGEK